MGRRGSWMAVVLAAGTLAGETVRASDAGPGQQRVLLVDFVDLGPTRAGRSDGALVELVNASSLTLSVVIGAGSTTLEPDARLYAGVEPGRVPVRVTAREDSQVLLEGDLDVAGGRRYELAFAYAVPPPSKPAVADEVAATEADAPGATPRTLTAEPRTGDRRGDESPEPRRRVDIGRRKKR